MTDKISVAFSYKQMVKLRTVSAAWQRRDDTLVHEASVAAVVRYLVAHPATIDELLTKLTER